ncbi:MAG TPA: (2Fe-2S)-binding protein [Glycomyces sp.]|nr:(2Fe-2S)-binding protein [Glycomyces sp.]
MYACICHAVHESVVHDCIRAGARTEEAIGEACDAGTSCGTCHERLVDMIETYFTDAVPAAA